MKTTLAPATIGAAVKAGLAGTLNDTEPGLRLWIGTGGTATWQWRGRDGAGRVRTFGLGHFPQVGLSEARRLARQMGHRVRYEGADPVAAARARRTSAKTLPGNTLAGLLDLYGRGERAASWASQMRPQIERVFRQHLDTPLFRLTLGELQFIADNHPKPKSASFGVRCLLTVLRWAAAAGRSYVGREMLDLQAPAGRPTRDRVLSREELAKLLPVLRADISPYASAMRLILLTAVRRGEVEAARWRDIDFRAGTWTLRQHTGPDGRDVEGTKNTTVHIVPLSRQAIALLHSIAPSDPDPAAHVFTTATGKPLNAWENATARFQAASGTNGWQRHDLRRSAATLMGEMGVLPDIVAAALNHIVIRSSLETIYNKSRYRPEVAAALQRLADALEGIERGAAEVISLPARSVSLT
jgi:integrase